jgi:hypothetical protein
VAMAAGDDDLIAFLGEGQGRGAADASERALIKTTVMLVSSHACGSMVDGLAETFVLVRRQTFVLAHRHCAVRAFCVIRPFRRSCRFQLPARTWKSA